MGSDYEISPPHFGAASTSVVAAALLCLDDFTTSLIKMRTVMDASKQLKYT